MKHLSKPIFIFLLLGLGISSCKDDDDYTPPLTGYFYCKINGQNFSRVPSFPCQSLTFAYYPNGFLNAEAGTLNMSATDCVRWKTVGMNLFGLNQSSDTIFLSHQTQLDSCRAFFLDQETPVADFLLFENLMSGFIVFDQFSDKQGDQNGIVSGTFEFTVRNEELDSTVVVTEGRFRYIIDYEWY